MKFKLLLAMGVAVASLTACEDLFEDGSLQPDGSHPYLVIHAPTKSQALSKAAGIRLKFSVSDKDKVKEVQVRVRESEAGTDVVQYTTEPGKSWVDTDTLLLAGKLRAGYYTLTVQATDFRTNVSADTVSFTVK
jgi:hypothetical protein